MDKDADSVLFTKGGETGRSRNWVYVMLQQQRWAQYQGPHTLVLYGQTRTWEAWAKQRT